MAVRYTCGMRSDIMVRTSKKEIFLTGIKLSYSWRVESLLILVNLTHSRRHAELTPLIRATLK